MQCVNCGSDLLPGKPFCPACGTRAVQACGRCGGTVDPGFRFCPACGTAVAEPAAAPATPPPAAPEDPLAQMTRHIPAHLAEKIRAGRGAIAGERKLVTVLFCDLVGSTAIAERLDPEEYRDLLAQYLAVAFREVYAVEGIVNQLAGDGIMALFGAPIAHEDAPYRAVYAALAIREGLREMNGRLRAGTPELQVRIGVHTGPVVVGSVGNDLKMDYTAIGDTTNLAARLQTAAEPGMVLVSEATHRLVRGFFRVKPGRRLEVKGKTEPVTAFAVVGLSDTTTPMAIAQARGLTPFVGRRGELAQLAACFERVSEGMAQIVAIGGDAGSGKSRLLYEFKERLADVPVTFFEARCAAMTQGVPYAPWIGMLRDYFGVTAAEAPESASRKVCRSIATLGPEAKSLHAPLCHLLAIPLADPPPAEQPESDAKRLSFHAVADLISLAAARAPVVMIIEDLHWMDEPSREMLDLAAGKICQTSELMVVSHRPDHQPFWRTLAPFTQINLQPLSEEETTAIVRAVAGGPLPAELEHGILAKAEGNPFFTEEITRTLVEEGYLLRSDGHVRVTRPPAEMRLPGTIEELIGARLDRLDPQAKRTVQVAAVLGRQFQRAQLEDLLADEGIDVATELAALEERGIIHRKALLSTDEFRFGESLTQDVAYGGLLLRQRRELHTRIGRMIEGAPGEMTPDRSALLAHHYALTDDWDRAMDALLRAARDAETIPAFPTAARFYQRAWRLAREALADGAPEPDAARRALEAAHGIARMIVMYGATYRDDLTDVMERARPLAEALGDRDTLSSLLALHGMALTSTERARYDEGRALIDEALRVAEQGVQPLSVVRVARALAWGYLFDGRLADAQAQTERVLAELARLEPGEPRSDVYLGALFMRDRLRFHCDDVAAAARDAEATFARGSEAGNGTVQAGSAATLAGAAFLQGRYAEAREWAERSLAICERIGNLGQVRPVAAFAILARRELGEPAVPRHAELLARGPVVGGEPLWAPLIVEAFMAVGDLDGAEQFTRLAQENSGGRLRQAASMTALGLVLAHRGPGRWHEAGALLDAAWPMAEEHGARSLLATIALARGELASTRGEREAALAHLEDARTRFAALGFARYAVACERLTAAVATGAQESA